MNLTYSVHLACNDPDTGNFAGRLYGVQIYHDHEIALDLEGPIYADLLEEAEEAPPLPVLNSAFLQFQNKRFPVASHGTWVGNWCWDSVEMSAAALADFLNALRASELFQDTGGWCDVSDVWSAPVSITEGALRKALDCEEESQ